MSAEMRGAKELCAVIRDFIELVTACKPICSRLPLCAKCIRLCYRSIARVVEGGCRSVADIADITGMVSELENILRLCGRYLVRLAVVSDAIELAAAPRGTANRNERILLSSYGELINKAMKDWDSLREEGASAVASITYMLFGHAGVDDGDLPRVRMEDGPWLVEACQEVESLLAMAAYCIAHANPDAQTQSHLIERYAQLDDLFLSVRSRMRNCKELAIAVLELGQSQEDLPEVPSSVRSLWTNAQSLLGDDVSVISGAESSGVLDGLAAFGVNRNNPTLTIPRLLRAIELEADSYPRELLGLWLDRGLRGLAARNY